MGAKLEENLYTPRNENFSAMGGKISVNWVRGKIQVIWSCEII